MRAKRRRIEILRARDGDNCAICRRPIDFTLPLDGGLSRVPGRSMGASIDHRIPLAAGGSSQLPNLQLAHGRCNQQKGSKHEGIDYADANNNSPEARAGRALRGIWHRRRNANAEDDWDSWSAARS